MTASAAAPGGATVERAPVEGADAVRWRVGERFHDLYDEASRRAPSGALAVDLAGEAITHGELRRRSERLARALTASGVPSGARVGLLFDRSAHPFSAMLAVSRVGAAWVPLDTAFPADRIAYICADAGVAVVLTRAHLADSVRTAGLTPLVVDDLEELDDLPDAATDAGDDGVGGRMLTSGPPDDLAYVVYTSGTTGRPKGVAVAHSSICNFLRVAVESYGFGPDDRVYQGLTIAFDFSFEEVWVPLLSGATLVPGPPSGALLGEDLARFLEARAVTALCCVPTMLATLPREVEALRLVIVSGEACPADLVARWARPHRRLLNVYGPTETTVTATWVELRAGDPVTIGRALPTYETVVLHPDRPEVVADGEAGELAIGGPGVALGYLGRDDLTAKAFVADPRRPGRRLYRSGDLCRVDADGRLVYLGRIDTQVKIRGYRIEVSEIESLLLAHPGIVQAAVTTHETPAGDVELAAFYTTRSAAADADDEAARFEQAVLSALREALPPYMVPATLDRLDALPVLPSDKVDRSRLPAPRPRRLDPAGVADPPQGDAEQRIAAALGEVMGMASVPASAHLFQTLGADSLRVARLCSMLRTDPRFERITTRIVYENPTVRAMARALASQGKSDAPPARAGREPHVASRAAHVACGAAQVGCMALYLLLLGALGTWAYDAIEGYAPVDAFLHSVGVAAATLAILALLPIVLKWSLIGRFRPGAIPAWGLAYLRFWIVRNAMRLSPAVLFAGTPVYTVYLRLLGVSVGRDALVLTKHAPIATDLVRIGPECVIRDEVKIDGYRVEAGWVVFGPIDLGAGSLVGEGSLVDIDTALDDGAELAHASTLTEGVRVPAGRRWHGCPPVDAGPVRSRFYGRPVPAAHRALFSIGQLVGNTATTAVAAVAGLFLALWIDVSHPLRALAVGVGLLVVLVVLRVVLPRVAGRFLQADRAYPLYGGRHAMLQLATFAGNSKLFNELFGDSSAIVHYLRAIGYRFRNPVQTGSNFGTAQRQHVSTLCVVGGGSIVSDGLSLPNAEYSAHEFRVRPVAIGERVFMGNAVIYPPGAVVGDDVLIATKAMVPDDGPRREGVGLLGSPAFDIPRTVARDTAFDHLREGEALRRGLAAKNRHNAVSGVLYLGVRFLALLVSVLAISVVGHEGPLGLALGLGASIAAAVALLVVVDTCSRGFRRLRPAYCSLYDRAFWRHERYWKLNDISILNLFDGTPIKPWLWRALGARIGRQLLDDGAAMPERSLVTIGDHVTLGSRSIVHGHSLEDGTFKSDRIRLGSLTTIGPAALVHYGTDLAERTVVVSDAFVMKGESTAPGSVWAGNPAQPVVARRA